MHLMRYNVPLYSVSAPGAGEALGRDICLASASVFQLSKWNFPSQRRGTLLDGSNLSVLYSVLSIGNEY